MYIYSHEDNIKDACFTFWNKSRFSSNKGKLQDTALAFATPTSVAVFAFVFSHQRLHCNTC